MTMTASATATVGATSETILRFVVDLQSYRIVDQKILKVWSMVGPDEDGLGSARVLGRMKGLPPAPDKHEFLLKRWTSIRFTGARRQPARAVYDFVGTVDCVDLPQGRCRLTHAYEFSFRGPFKLLERFLGKWLDHQVSEEVSSIVDYFDRPVLDD